MTMTDNSYPATASVHQTGPDATSLPVRPPAGGSSSKGYGPGSASELRNQLAAIQQQIDAITSKVAQRQAEDPSDPGIRPSEQSALNALNTRASALATSIAAAESRQPTVISGQNPNDRYVVRQMPDGTLVTEPNINWDGKTAKAQTGQMGNRIYTVSTDDQGNPQVTIAYTDQDAQDLAGRQTAVAEANARTAAASQAANDYATRARVEFDQRVANREDAAAVRAEQTQELARLHQEWVQADGDARRRQDELRDYETTRHSSASEQLAQDQLTQTREWQAMQDATTRRSQDLSAQAQQATTRASLTNQRLSSGTGYMGNVMDMLAGLNKDVAPGSSAVGEMLLPLLGLGQNFFGQLGGLEQPDQVLAGQAAANMGQPPAAGANPMLPGSAPPGVPPPAAAAQARSVPLAPDGSPYVTPDYVAQMFAQRRNPQQMAGSNLAPQQSGPLMG